MEDERNLTNNKKSQRGRKRSNTVAAGGGDKQEEANVHFRITHSHRNVPGQNPEAFLQASLEKKFAEKLDEMKEIKEQLQKLAEQLERCKRWKNDSSHLSIRHQDTEFAPGQRIRAPRALLDHPQPSKSEARQTDTFHLKFVYQIKELFTGDFFRVEVQLLDFDGKCVAGRDTILVEIIVLHGDYEPVHKGTDDQLAKFHDKDIVCPREGKGLLVSKSCGKPLLKMENGVGVIDDILKFVDNLSWTRSKMFKLGARVIESKSSETVGEAVSNAFRVKDGRGKDSQKHDNPNLNDEVWRLKGIGKCGPKYQQLCQNEIVKMIDFLRLYNVDQSSLRNLLKVSDKQWEEIIKQATLCPLTHDKYSSTHPNYNAELVYNCIWEIDGVFLDGNYQDFQTLNEHQKGFVRKMRHFAYKNKMIRPFGSQGAYDGSTSQPNGINSFAMVASPNLFNVDVGATGLDSFDIGNQASCRGNTSLPNETSSFTMVASPNLFNADVGATGLDSFDIGNQASCRGNTSLPNETSSFTMVASPNLFNVDVGATGLDSFDILNLYGNNLESTTG